jgi:arginase family enzyme
VAGARRYFRSVNVIYLDSDADLNVPATTPTGCVDGMVISHLTGRGAPELVRFWGEPQLVREPDVTLFGVHRLDPPEEKFLETSTLRKYSAADVKRKGAAAAAQATVERIKTNKYDFVLHLDVDVIAGFSATNYPSADGLTLDEVREAMLVFAQQPQMAVLEIAAYNPEKDADGSGAKALIGLIAEVLEARYATLKDAAAAAPPPAPKASAAKREATPAPEPVEDAPAGAAASEDLSPELTPGESWSSDSLTDEPTHDADSVDNPTSDEPSEPRS